MIELYTYRARVVRVVDGDTLDVELDMGLRVYRRERIRLLGVDTPEIRRKKDQDKRFEGYAAKAFLELMLLGAISPGTSNKMIDNAASAPEGWTPEKPRFLYRQAVKNHIDHLPLIIDHGQAASVIIRTEKGDAFGRWLGEIYIESEELGEPLLELAGLLIKAGLGKPIAK